MKDMKLQAMEIYWVSSKINVKTHYKAHHLKITEGWGCRDNPTNFKGIRTDHMKRIKNKEPTLDFSIEILEARRQ